MAIKFDKERLMGQLLEDTSAAKVHFLAGTVAFSAEDAADGVTIQVTANGQHSSIKGQKAAIAEGVNAHVTGSLGLNKDRQLFAVARALKIAVKGTHGFEPKSWNLHYGRAYHSNAAVIVGPSLYGDDVVEVTLMASGKKGPNEIFDAVRTQSPLAQRFVNAEVIDKQGCSVRAFPSLKVPYEGNVLVVGDAAAYVEIETQGALMCGFHAGRAIAEELDGENGFERYTKWWKDSFEFNTDDYLLVAQGFALVPTYSDDELDYLFALAEDEILEGSYSQYKTPELIWKSFLRDPEKIAAEMPQLYEKIQNNSQMTLSTLSAES
jgi:flavin-dependent dehydrogenase